MVWSLTYTRYPNHWPKITAPHPHGAGGYPPDSMVTGQHEQVRQVPAGQPGETNDSAMWGFPKSCAPLRTSQKMQWSLLMSLEQMVKIMRNWKHLVAHFQTNPALNGLQAQRWCHVPDLWCVACPSKCQQCTGSLQTESRMSCYECWSPEFGPYNYKV